MHMHTHTHTHTRTHTHAHTHTHTHAYAHAHTHTHTHTHTQRFSTRIHAHMQYSQLHTHNTLLFTHAHNTPPPCVQLTPCAFGSCAQDSGTPTSTSLSTQPGYYHPMSFLETQSPVFVYKYVSFVQMMEGQHQGNLVLKLCPYKK